MRRFTQAGGPHRLRDPRHRIVEEWLYRLRRDIARPEAGATGQDDQVGIGRSQPFSDLPLDVVDLVADDGTADDLGGNAGHGLANPFATFVDPFATGAFP